MSFLQVVYPLKNPSNAHLSYLDNASCCYSKECNLFHIIKVSKCHRCLKQVSSQIKTTWIPPQDQSIPHMPLSKYKKFVYMCHVWIPAFLHYFWQHHWEHSLCFAMYCIPVPVSQKTNINTNAITLLLYNYLRATGVMNRSIACFSFTVHVIHWNSDFLNNTMKLHTYALKHISYH